MLRTAALAALICSSPAALAGEKIEFDFGGMVQYDLRFRLQDIRAGTFYQPQPDVPTLSRNELIGKFKLGAKFGRFGMKSDLDFVLRAYPQVETLDDLYLYNRVTPFRFEAHSLYLYARDLLVPGFDMRIGQQKAMFGVGDQFNPTNTVNAWDFEDPLLFGDQQGNLMVRLDYTPVWNWTMTGILVPVFKPALLPRTGYLAQTPDRYPFVNDTLRYNLNAEQESGFELFGYPTVVDDIIIQQPDFHPRNFQGFFRLGAILGGQDIALSYYRGYSDIPQPIQNTTSQRAFDQQICETNWLGEEICASGVLESDVVLSFPRMHVAGFNMTGEFNAFGWVHKSFKPLGYRVEFAAIFPEDVGLEIQQDDINFSFINKNGEYEYPFEERLLRGVPQGTRDNVRIQGDNRVVTNRPFFKWTVGLDYTFNKHLYMNTQWVHGFPDEFGAGSFFQDGWTVRASGVRPGVEAIGTECLDLSTFSGIGETCASEYIKPRIGDYLVWGTDINFLANSALLRLFVIWDLIGVYENTWDEESGERVLIHHGPFSRKGASLVLYPAFQYNFGRGFDVQAGVLLNFGQRWTKFGAPEVGGHQVWTRARFRF
jgi:hypothetical protein